MLLDWLVQFLPEQLRTYLTKEDDTGAVAQWLPLVLMAAAMALPAILPLLMGKRKPRTFLNANEWQDLPLLSKEVRLPTHDGACPLHWPIRPPAAGACKSPAQWQIACAA